MRKFLLVVIIGFTAVISFADGISETLPRLNDNYGFTEEYDLRAAPIAGKRAGCYPVGNGQVFGSLGVRDFRRPGGQTAVVTNGF